MAIAPDDVARVRAATDLVALAGEHVALRRVGLRWVGLCPFHGERTGSFSVNGELGLYHCFGCGAGGDAITFVQQVEHLTFAEAVELLAARAGITLRHDDAVPESHRQRARLVQVMERAVEWYHQRLLSAPDAAPARAYLRGRGYDGDVVRRYRLGWAPDAWDELCRALSLDDDVMVETGLGFRNRIGRRQDVFRARIMFPIFDTKGDPVAFGGRHLEGSAPPKYKNSSETALYSKSRVLYGLNWAKAAVVERREVVVCEGYTDVIGLATAGVPHAVATCGTALAEGHFRMLKNFARRVVLAYDADSAGQAAAERFYEWERRYEVDVAVARLPPGSDPGQIALADPDGLRRAVSEARPFLAFRLERVLDSADFRSPEGRARAAEAAMAVIGEHPSDLVRDEYVMEVADRLRIDPARLRRRRPVPVPADGAAPEAPAAPSAARAPRAEVEALRAVVAKPEQAAGRVHEILFTDPTVRAGLRALEEAPTLAEAVDSAGEGPASLLRRLAVEDAEVDVDDALARVAERAARRVLADLERASRRSADPLAYNADVAWLKLVVEELRDPGMAPTATARLVAWLVARSANGAGGVEG